MRGKADIDLVLILNDINTAAQLEESLPSIQNKIEQYLKSANDLGFNVIRHTITKTRFAVQFTVQTESEEIKVDLLPSFYFVGKLICISHRYCILRLLYRTGTFWRENL